MPFKRPILKITTGIIFKHYLIGLLAITIGAWIIEEIPRWYTIEQDLIQWMVTILSIPLVGFLFAWRINVRLQRTEKNIYSFSVLIIFLTWILVLYAKAMVMGLIATFESGQEKVLESIAGYTIYQLWIYGGIGLIHGLLGGILLRLDLKKNLIKIKTARAIHAYVGHNLK